jgi:hypothetical protein
MDSGVRRERCAPAWSASPCHSPSARRARSIEGGAGPAGGRRIATMPPAEATNLIATYGTRALPSGYGTVSLTALVRLRHEQTSFVSAESACRGPGKAAPRGPRAVCVQRVADDVAPGRAPLGRHAGCAVLRRLPEPGELWVDARDAFQRSCRQRPGDRRLERRVPDAACWPDPAGHARLHLLVVSG